jgi:hypothetical protein
MNDKSWHIHHLLVERSHMALLLLLSVELFLSARLAGEAARSIGMLCGVVASHITLCSICCCCRLLSYLLSYRWRSSEEYCGTIVAVGLSHRHIGICLLDCHSYVLLTFVYRLLLFLLIFYESVLV